MFLKRSVIVIASWWRAVVISIRTNQPEAQIRFIEFGATLAGKKDIQ